MAAWPTITDTVTTLSAALFDAIKAYIDGLSTLTFSNTGLKLRDTDASHALTLAPGSNLTADRTLTVTTGDASRTLTLSGNATIGQDTTSSGTPTFAGVTSTGTVTVGGGATASELRLLEPSGSGSHYTGFKAQAQAGNVTYTLPAADGSAGQLLSTDGSGGLSWASAVPAVLSKSATYTVSTSDGANVLVLCTSTITINLYAASGNTGTSVTVKNMGTGTITIDGHASETIDGSLTQTIAAQYTSLTLLCDGSGWVIV